MSIELIAVSICIALTLCCIIGTMLTLAVQLRIWVKLEAFEKSTHQIQYVPVDPVTDEEGEEIVGDALEKNIREAMGEQIFEKEYI